MSMWGRHVQLELPVVCCGCALEPMCLLEHEPDEACDLRKTHYFLKEQKRQRRIHAAASVDG